MDNRPQHKIKIRKRFEIVGFLKDIINKMKQNGKNTHNHTSRTYKVILKLKRTG